MNEITLFCRALEIKDAAVRSDFVAQACGDDTNLLERITDLVESNEKAGPFMTPPIEKTSKLFNLEGKTRQFGEYEIEKEIGSGGMGVVFQARHLSLNRTVALKMIAPSRFQGQTRVDRFIREAELIASLDHPNVVPVYDFGQLDSQFYFTMKLIEGTDLNQIKTDYLKKPQQAAELIRKIAIAVHYAHQRGIIHRDLKPENILIDREGQPLVSDFGLAKREGDNSLSFAGLAGTPNFMSPEQVQADGSVTTSTDLFSLGAIFYTLLTGQPPFEGETTVQTLRNVVESEPVSPRKRNSKVDLDLETICLKCLQKNAEQRYTSANELAEDLRRALNHEPIAARPVTQLGKAKRWVRRHPAATTIASIIVVSLISVSFLLNSVLNANGTIGDQLDRQRLSLAQSEIQADNWVRAQQFLAMVEPDQRGWEWKHLYQLTQQTNVMAWATFDKGVNAMDLSDDGQQLLVTTDGETVLLHANSLRTIKKFDFGSRRLDLDPSGQQWVAAGTVTGSDDNQSREMASLRLRKLSSGEELFSKRFENQLILQIKAFDRNAYAVVWNASSKEKMIYGFDQTGKQLFSVLLDDSIPPHRFDGPEINVVRLPNSEPWLIYGDACIDAQTGQSLESIFPTDLACLQKCRKTLGVEDDDRMFHGRLDWRYSRDGLTRTKAYGGPGDVCDPNLWIESCFNGERIQTLGGSGDLVDLALSDDGHWLAVARKTMNLDGRDATALEQGGIAAFVTVVPELTNKRLPYTTPIDIFDTRNGKLLTQVYGFPRDDVGNMAFSSDRTKLYTSGGGLAFEQTEEDSEWRHGIVICWDISQPPQSRRINTQQKQIRSLSVNRDASQLAISAGHGSAQIWSLENGQLLHDLAMPAGSLRDREFIPQIEFGANESVFWTSQENIYAGDLGEATLDIFPNWQLYNKVYLEGLGSRRLGNGFDEKFLMTPLGDGDRILYTSLIDQGLTLFDTRDGSKTTLTESNIVVDTLGLTLPAGPFFMPYPGRNRGLRYHQPKWLPIAEIEQDSPAEKAGFQVGDEILSINGRPVAGGKTGSWENPLELNDAMWDYTKKGDEPRTFKFVVKRGQEELAITVQPRLPGDNQASSAQRFNEIPRSMIVSPQETYIALVYSGRHKPGRKNISRLELYDLDSGSKVFTFEHDPGSRGSGSYRYDGIADVAFSADGQKIYVATNHTQAAVLSSKVKSEVHVLDLRGNELKRWPLNQQDGIMPNSDVRAIAVNDTCQRIATGYASGTIMLWDLEDDSLRCELTDHRQGITDLLFTRDGKTLVSSSSDEVRIWASEGLTWWPAKPQGSDAREASEPSRE